MKKFDYVEKKLGKIKWREDNFKASDYVERWHILVWNKTSLICEIPPFPKGIKLLKFIFGEIAMKGIMYM